MNQEVEKTQRLRTGVERRELAWNVRVGSFVCRYEIHTQVAFGDIAGRKPIARNIGYLAKGLVHFLQHVEHGPCCLISHGDRHVGELCYIDVARFTQRAPELRTQHRWVSLICDRSDKYS